MLEKSQKHWKSEGKVKEFRNRKSGNTATGSGLETSAILIAQEIFVNLSKCYDA